MAKHTQIEQLRKPLAMLIAWANTWQNPGNYHAHLIGIAMLTYIAMFASLARHTGVANKHGIDKNTGRAYIAYLAMLTGLAGLNTYTGHMVVFVGKPRNA